MQQMSAAELNEYLKTAASPPILLDVREDWEYQTCHLENSLHIPMNDVPNALQQLDQDKTIVVICHHGMRSLQVAHYLETVGYENLINLRGGIDAWARDVDNTMPVY
jgi:rhodanese-related sulfurtransferase